jgi:ubiquitin carboxyl-terminal hydrolase 9/24
VSLLLQLPTYFNKLQNLFVLLKYSNKKFVSPDRFVKGITDYEGRPVNVRQQMDVDEFVLGFFDSIERTLQKMNKIQIVDELFMGKVYQEIVGAKCNHKSLKEDKFLAITLTTKKISSLTDALDHYIRWETLEGDNSYFCELCNAKVVARKRIALANLPKILIVVLKRFEFDSRIM